jgi:hypothetical protein
LVWKPSNGKDIRIGADPMIGSQNYYKPSRNLINTLKAQGIEYIAQAGGNDLEDTSYIRWKKVESLGLEGEQKEEWNMFVRGLIGS